jgi:hypothetical protein
MAQVFKYTGKVTLYSSRPKFPGPKEVDNVSFELHELGDGKSFSVMAFSPVHIDDVDTPEGLKRLTASMDGVGKAEFEPGTGALSITADFRFKLNVLALKPSFLPLTVNTKTATLPSGGTVHGEPVGAGTGTVQLVGRAVFKESILEGDTCGVVLRGVFQPSPR